MSDNAAQTAAAARKRQNILDQESYWKSTRKDLYAEEQQIHGLASRYGYGGVQTGEGSPAFMFGPQLEKIHKKIAEARQKEEAWGWKSLSFKEQWQKIQSGEEGLPVESMGPWQVQAYNAMLKKKVTK
jgi:hypothetical protein